MATPTQTDMHSYHFDDVVVDRANFRIQKDGQTRTLAPRAFDLLVYLIEHRDRVIEKQELFERIWKESFVTDNALARSVKDIRRAIGDDADAPRYIGTVPKRGYRFIADAREVRAEAEEVNATTDLLGEQENADALDRALENERASSAVAEKEIAPLAVRESTSTSAIKRRAVWLSLALIAGLMAAGAAIVFWLGKNPSRTNEQSAIKKTAQLTFWSGLDFYPAISPDGNTVAFSSDRSGSFEIYVKQLVAGASEARLTYDGGQNFEPAFSPGGNLIAYYSKNRGGIWIIPLTGGAAKQIADFGSNPAWSPDGSQIAFQSDPIRDIGFNVHNAQPPSTIWLISAEGGEPKQLTETGHPAGGHGAPSWSPDGKRIAFDSGDVATSTVWSVSLQGGDLKSMSADLKNGSDAVYSPDGKTIYFITDGGSALQKVNLSFAGEPMGEPVRVFYASGSRIRQISISADGKRFAYSALSTSGDILTTAISPTGNKVNHPPAQLTQSKNARNTGPAFSPDGKRIAYTVSSVGATHQVWEMEADGSNKKQLTDNGFRPWWFPDGNHIGYSYDVGSSHEFWSVTVEGGKKKRLFDLGEDASAARLSPDGKQVAFHSSRSGARNIWLAPIEGGEPKQLTFDKEAAGFPAWSPDGKWLALELHRSDSLEVAFIPSAGGEPMQLTFGKEGGFIYDWSPDSDKVIFAGQRSDIWNIYSVSRLTREIKKLTDFTKINSYARYPAWSPTGDKVAYEYAETTGNIWLMELK